MVSAKVDVLKRRIQGLQQLPTLPTIATEVMGLIRSPQSSMGALAQVIENDPALASKVLKVANSAFYGMRERVASLQFALTVLGMNEINNIVVSLSVVTAFPETPGRPTFDRDRFWQHCAACGQIAKALAERMDLNVAGEAFVGGLTHDIGRIVLDQYFHNDAMEVVSRSQARQITVLEAEREVLSTTHAEVGSWVAERWGLPKAIVETIAAHHGPESARTYQVLADLVYLANTLTQPVEHTDEEAAAAVAEAMAAPSWGRLAERSARFGRQDPSMLAQQLEEEVGKARDLVRISQAPDEAEVDA